MRKGKRIMVHIVSITNQKGGVGKTSTTHALGTALSMSGKRVLFIDIDPQGNLSNTLKAHAETGSAYEVLTGTIPIVQAIQRTAQGDCLRASPMLSGADRSLDRTGKEYILKEALAAVESQYDFILIDTPPALSILTVNALTASSSLIIPSQADVYSLQGIGQLYQTIGVIRKYCNPSLAIAGILIVRFNSRIILNKEISVVMEQTAEQLQTRVFASKIRECIAVKEAQAKQTDLFSYAPDSTAAADYELFIREYLGGLND
jgi:chromosome partitioning protein